MNKKLPLLLTFLMLGMFFLNSLPMVGQHYATKEQQALAEKSTKTISDIGLKLSTTPNATRPSAVGCETATPITSGNIVDELLICGTENLLNSTSVGTFCNIDINDGTTINAGYSNGIEATYTYEPSVDGAVTIKVSDVTWAAIFVYSGCPTDGGTCVASTKSTGSSRTLTFNAVEGVEYFIWIDTWPSPASPCATGGRLTFTGPEPAGGGTGGDDCAQGDDSNGFENGLQIGSGTNFKNADDFIVSAGNTLDLKSIEINILANNPVDSIDLTFYADDNGAPGSTIVATVTNANIYGQSIVGSAFGFNAYTLYINVESDNLSFTGGATDTTFWMSPKAQAANGAVGGVFWEVTSIGTLGEPIHSQDSGGPWIADADGDQAVFKLNCEVVEVLPSLCLFNISSTIEPITRVLLADIDNTSSATVGGSPALEDFTAVEGNVELEGSYEIALEGNTNGNYTTFFTVFIDWNQNGDWTDAGEMYQIGSIKNSTGTDGKQAVGTIVVPADALPGATTMRVIKNYNSSPTNPCGTYSFGQGEDYTIIVGEGGDPADDCGQGDDSNGFENGFQIGAGTDFRNADDFMVSAGSTLTVKSIELNILANNPIDSVNLTFYEDDNGAPGSTVVATITGAEIYAQSVVGSAFGFNGYTVYINVENENLDFTAGATDTKFWMSPVAQAAGGAVGGVFWEISSVGTLGEPIHTKELNGPWEADEDDSQAVFKINCEVVEPLPSQCLFNITSSVEPITRVLIADIDNTSSATVNGSPALEDFTDVEGNVALEGSYEIVLEGNTNGNYTTYFTVFVDWNQNGVWTDAGEMYEIGSINNSTGTDGKQAIGNIVVPADALLGPTTMRIIKNFNSSPTNPCGSYSYGQGEDYTIIVGEGGTTGEDCGQGDDSNGFENGFQIGSGTDFTNADDFIVSAGNTLVLKSIELNVLANNPIESINLTFYEDDNGAPGTTVVATITDAQIYGQSVVGSAFGFNGYTVYINVENENLEFTGGASDTRFWMSPTAQAAGGSTGGVFWEISSVGTLGEPIHTKEAGGPWEADEDGSQAVFKLNCDVVDPLPSECLFNITSSIEPITRVLLADIDNTSSATVNGSPALEDFTNVEGTVGQGGTYEVRLEGNTDGPYTNYFTVFIDWNQNGDWTDAGEMYEIGSITSSTGTDGKQAIGNIVVPADAVLGSTTMRIVKNFNSSPTNPCGSYSFGQGEDYTILVDDTVGITDISKTSISVYPNPATDVLNISANGEIANISMYNLLGQQVITNTKTNNGQVDVSNLQEGVYMLKVTMMDGKESSFKVVKD